MRQPRETIVSVKRFMGRGGDDPETRRLGPYAFAPVKPGESNVVRFVVHGKNLTPVEVSAEIPPRRSRSKLKTSCNELAAR